MKAVRALKANAHLRDGECCREDGQPGRARLGPKASAPRVDGQWRGIEGPRQGVPDTFGGEERGMGGRGPRGDIPLPPLLYEV